MEGRQGNGGTEETTVQYRLTGAVLNDHSDNGGSIIIEDSDVADVVYTVHNREAEATTGGEVHCNTGADES